MTSEDNYFRIPTWDNGVFCYTEFFSRKEFFSYLLSVFKEPGKYEFDESSKEFNRVGEFYNTNKFYCEHIEGTLDFEKYWDLEKEKCTLGYLIKNNGNAWYLTREYYMWLNFLPIKNKEKGNRLTFASIRDAQYHMALYEMLAELNFAHASILKKRQIASSFFHTAKIVNKVWFDEGAITMIGASSKEYVLKSWDFMEEYRSFLNLNTAWYRPMNPGKSLLWEQKIEQEDKGRKSSIGLKSSSRGVTFEKSPTAGVGGPTQLFFYEEAGIAKTMDQTYEYMRPAMMSGDIATGLFIAAGSVGDLKECEPLKNFTLEPQKNGFFYVESNLLDENWTYCKTGLFIPEQWSMMPYIDEYGNSDVEGALESILEQRKLWKYGDKEKGIDPLSPEMYQLRVSQKPINIKEAFDYRDESVFSLSLVNAQKRRIEDKEYPLEYVDLEEDATGKIKIIKSNKIPIRQFPVNRSQEDKTGIICMHERPPENPKWNLYFASIDPVATGKTSTSESLCSIYIYKNSVEIIKEGENGRANTSEFEEGKIVAYWCGRYDDINDTHKRLELMIRLYNARTLCENNVSLFIRHMIEQKLQRYLVRKDEILFLKEANSNNSVYQEYGWKNTGSLFEHMLSYLIEYTSEVIDTETKEDGTIVKKVYGISRIPDPLAMEEMARYRKGLNVDRLISLSALIAFVKLQDSLIGVRKVKEQSTQSLENNEKIYNLKRTPFKNIGRNSGFRNRPFKNIR